MPREILFDQMASVITRDLRDRGGRLMENAEFLRFAAHWGFRVRACRPYRAEDLRELFSLTPAEARVNLLLAEGRSNAEVARELFISSHWGRRHTERVLQQLDVRSRAEVGAKLYA